MKKADAALSLIMNISKVNSLLSRKFDSLSAHGISFSDFTILYLLKQAPGGKLRRIDLADRIGLTPSGVTRMLVPMEKIGLIAREANERDARVSYAAITETGKSILEDAMVTAVTQANLILPDNSSGDKHVVASFLSDLGGNIF
jgi:DNA-binding MarR family transcriptional regulator